MSMLFRDVNGIETPVAGLNGTSGELVPSVSYYQSGNKTSDTTSWSTGETGTFSINLSENMPDADYVVVPTLNVAGVSAIVHAKTINSFKVTVRNDRTETINQAITLYWQAFKLMTDESRALDEQAISDHETRIDTLEDAKYYHLHENMYNGGTVKISGFKTTSGSSSGETFIIRNRGGEIITLTIGDNSQDSNVAWNYSAVRTGYGSSKIQSLAFDYTNRELYITCASFGALDFIQVAGQRDELSLTTGATVPSSGVYTIPITDMCKMKDITVTTNSNFKGGSIIAKRIGRTVTVTLMGVSWNYTGTDTVFATGLPKAVQNWYQLCLNVAGNTCTCIVDTNGQLFGGLDAGVNVWHSFTYLTSED